MSSKVPACDCEKKYDINANKDGQQLPSQQNHVHVSFDEFDVPVKNTNAPMIRFQNNNYSTYDISSLASFNGSIFRPPQL